MDEAKLKALLAEATAHCFDEEDEFSWMFSALVRGLSFPLQATVAGEAVTLTGLDGHTSNLETGVMAQAKMGDQEKSVHLGEVELMDADATSTEWLAAYRLWVSKRW